MQNVYDLAHELVRSLKETDQMKNFNDAKAELNKNPQTASMMKDFQEKSMVYQAKLATGQPVTEEENVQMQQLSVIIMSDPVAAQYINAQMQLAPIVQDIYNIIGGAIEV